MKRARRAGGRSGGTSTVFVIFGSSGNLATTRLIPAIRSLQEKGALPGRALTVGVDRRSRRGGPALDGFVRGDLEDQGTYSDLAAKVLGVAGEGSADVLLYLATKPQLFPQIVSRLSSAGLNRGGWRRTRIVVEKPFGVDLRSARLLEGRLRSSFRSGDVFRMDHFLGKQGALRMALPRSGAVGAERGWDRRSVDHVQIMADEEAGVEGRGDFYDTIGVVRDMIQNHLLQLLCLVAMERPASDDPLAWAREKARVLRGLRLPPAEGAVWGQYPGYDRVRGVKSGSRTPTFVALKISLADDRWLGVPFYVRSGRRLARTATEVVVAFKEPAAGSGGARLRPVRFSVDPPGAKGEDEYERLLLAASRGDQTLFVGAGFNELAWRAFDPLLKGLERRRMEPNAYEPGSWGPAGSDALLAADGRSWLDGRAR